jgi:hypothetical protein
MRWTLGSLRDLQAFSWLRDFSASKQSPRPPQRQSTQTVGCYVQNQRIKNVRSNFFYSLLFCVRSFYLNPSTKQEKNGQRDY